VSGRTSGQHGLNSHGISFRAKRSIISIFLEVTSIVPRSLPRYELKARRVVGREPISL
jgi:hypothetical protein